MRSSRAGRSRRRAAGGPRRAGARGQRLLRPGGPPGVTGLRLDVAELLRVPNSRRHVAATVTDLDDLDDLVVVGSRVPPDGPVEVDLHLESMPSGVSVAGHVRAPWTGSCRRCLEDVGGELDVAVTEIFEVDHTEDETFPIEGGRIDLEPVVREAVLLGLPLAPLCREGCRGPSPGEFPARAAGELETGDDDATPGRDPRWAALDDLRFD
ncbi:MAG: DUF177 domain-containing protein [Acidimicrobiia bacterium]|nr:DUF177 domain-containing protein [Acidimicrobiia bacterium]